MRSDDTGFRPFADALPGPLCLVDAAGTITWVNAAWRAFAAENGYGGGAFEGLNYLATCAAAQGAEREDAQAVGEGLLQVLRRSAPTFGHTYSCHGPGVRRWFQLAVAPFGDGALLLHLPTSAPAVAPQMAASRLFTQIAHELQSPLATMSGFSQLIADGVIADVPDMARDYARQIQEASLHLGSIVDDTLDLTQATEKTMRLNEVDTPAEELVTLACALVRREAEAGKVTVTSDFGCGAVLLCDPRRMTQVLVNLLGNAIKFSAPGTSVQVRAEPEDGGGCVLRIIDQGMGMEAEEIPLALRPYGRSHAARAADLPGLGLGLPLARALVELHGGRLEITSTPAVGTTVTIRLPRWRIVSAGDQPAATPR